MIQEMSTHKVCTYAYTIALEILKTCTVCNTIKYLIPVLILIQNNTSFLARIVSCVPTTSIPKV